MCFRQHFTTNSDHILVRDLMHFLHFRVGVKINNPIYLATLCETFLYRNNHRCAPPPIPFSHQDGVHTNGDRERLAPNANHEPLVFARELPGTVGRRRSHRCLEIVPLTDVEIPYQSGIRVQVYYGRGIVNSQIFPTNFCLSVSTFFFVSLSNNPMHIACKYICNQ
jgi:hypothetical protein